MAVNCDTSVEYISPSSVINDGGTDEEPLKPCGKWRYVVCAASFFGFFFGTMQRVSFVICLVAMVNSTTPNVSAADECPLPKLANNKTEIQTGEFNWGTTVQSQLIGGFYYGYVIPQIVGGYLAERFGASRGFGLCIFLSGVLTTVTPFIARWDVKALLASRILVGIFQGPMFPANHAQWGQWSPVFERSRMYSISTSGGAIGYFVGFAGAGYLANGTLFGGWPLPLYLSGILSCLWYGVWILVTSKSPADHKYISVEERKYIEASIWKHGKVKYSNPPWTSIVRSRAVWSVVVYYLFDGIGFYVLFSGVPLYMKHVLHYDISADGLVSALPYVAGFISIVLSGEMADSIRYRRWMSTTNVRKMMALFGGSMMGAMLVSIALSGCNHIRVTLFLVLTFFFNGFMSSGATVAILDFAPRYAGTLLGIANTISNCGGFISPAIVGSITQNSPNINKWHSVFYLTTGVYSFAVFTFLILGTSEPVDWALGKKQGSLLEDSEADEQSDVPS